MWIYWNTENIQNLLLEKEVDEADLMEMEFEVNQIDSKDNIDEDCEVIYNLTLKKLQEGLSWKSSIIFLKYRSFCWKKPKIKRAIKLSNSVRWNLQWLCKNQQTNQNYRFFKEDRRCKKFQNWIQFQKSI